MVNRFIITIFLGKGSAFQKYVCQLLC